jgi:hypothetical protein
VQRVRPKVGLLGHAAAPLGDVQKRQTAKAGNLHFVLDGAGQQVPLLPSGVRVPGRAADAQHASVQLSTLRFSAAVPRAAGRAPARLPRRGACRPTPLPHVHQDLTVGCLPRHARRRLSIVVLNSVEYNVQIQD